MEAATAQLVRQRAGNLCEYCHLRFHVEHIVARQHRGSDDADNLALACPECNLHKGTNLTSIDPDTGKITQLYHPRRERWEDHFTSVEGRIVGKTATGRTTAWLLEMNVGANLRLRQRLFKLGYL